MANKFQKGYTTLNEEITIDKLPVKGKVPEWLQGSLFRNGPAMFEVNDEKFQHWFDGQGMVHKFSLNRGEISYANRFIQSRGYKGIKEKGKITYEEFATRALPPFFLRMIPRLKSPEFSHNTLVNIINLDGKLLTVTEIPEPIEMDKDNLSTIGVFDYGDDIEGNMSTAHFHFDPQIKAFFNFTIAFAKKSWYHLYTIPYGFRKRFLIHSVPVKEPAYLHSFAITENYFIITEPPLVVNPVSIVMGVKPLIKNYKWKPERGTRFTVVEKQTGRLVGIFETDPFFLFHHINAFEENGVIVLDLPAYPDSTVVNALYLDKLLGENGGSLPHSQGMRYRLNPASRKVESEKMFAENMEFPTINYPRYNTKEYTCTYGVGTRHDLEGDYFNKLIKVNVESGKINSWFEDDCYPGEPIFIESPQAKTEDDGVILSVVLDGAKGSSFLLILNAETFKELARAEVPHHIPFGFHGNWFNDV